MRIVLAFFVAALTPALIITGWYLYGQFITFEPNDPYIWVRTGGFLFLCIIVSTIYVVVLGIPAYFLILKLKIVRWWSTLGVGFILGATPMAIFTWPFKYPELKTSASSNGVQTMIDGVPTLAGWLEFIYGVAFLGWCGIVGSLAFWLVISNKSR